AIFAAEELVGLGVAENAAGLGVPLQLAAGAVGDVAEQDRLAQEAAVGEVAGSRATFADGLEPFAVVTDGARNARLGRGEIAEAVLGQKLIVIVIGNEAALVTFEQDARAERMLLRIAGRAEVHAIAHLAAEVRARDAVIPGEMH